MSAVDDGYAAAEAQIAAWAEQSRAQLRHAQALGQAVATTRVAEWSPARDVCVTLDGTGLLADLTITDKALDASALRLSATITATVRAALRRLPDELDRAAAAASGDDPLTRSLVDHSRRVVQTSLGPEPL